MIEITDINDSRIRLYRSLRKTPGSHKQEKVFVAEGEKVTEKLLKSRLEVNSIFALREYYEKFGELIKKRIPDESKRYFASRDFMNGIVGFRLHSGIMAVGCIPEPKNIYELSFPIAVLNGIVNSENVGSIVRNCAAFGFPSLIFDKKTSSPYLRRAVRVSMGTVFDLDIYETGDLFTCLSEFKPRSDVISCEISDNAASINSYIFKKDCVLVFGSEGRGIDSDILEVSTHTLYIPISDNVPSLNVAAASAVFMNIIRNQINQHP